MLRMHHLRDLLDAYSPHLLMSLKMQIKASQVLDGEGIKQVDQLTVFEAANQILVQCPAGSLRCSNNS